MVDFIAPVGRIIIEQDDAVRPNSFGARPEKCGLTDNIAGVQWGKLLLNLNNAINALAICRCASSSSSAHGACCSRPDGGGLAAIKAAGIKPVSSTRFRRGWTPHLLRLPDAGFGVLLGRTMRSIPRRRSSMWEAPAARPPHRIDYLQGVITAIADRHGLQVPLVAPDRDADQECRIQRQGFA